MSSQTGAPRGRWFLSTASDRPGVRTTPCVPKGPSPSSRRKKTYEPDTMLNEGDVLVSLGPREALRKLEEMASS